MAATEFHLKQLDGLRGPLAYGVIAITMGLYNAGANTPVGVFLVLSGMVSYLAYGDVMDEPWDDESRAQFFLRRLVRLLPMLLISAVFQECALGLWLYRHGTQIPELTSGGIFSFVLNSLSIILVLAGSGIICRGTACGCCRIDRWPRPPCSLFWLVFGSYLIGPGWYVGLLLFLNTYFLPRLLAAYGDTWRAAPPSWIVLLGWALLEALQFGLPLLVYATTHSADLWFASTLYIYFGLPPLFRLVTFVFGLHLGRWARFEERRERTEGHHRALTEATTLIPALATALIVAKLHGVFEPETEMHRPDTGATPLQWALIHLIHPFNVLALVCALVVAPSSLVARLLVSPPLALLAELSYAIYMLHYGVLIVYVWLFGKRWESEYERLEASVDAPALDVLDYAAVVLLCTGLAYPVTRWVEPRVAAWLKARVGPQSPAESALV